MSRLVIQGPYFDSISGNFISDHTIVIEDTIITWVGPTAQFQSEGSDMVLDYKDKFILPGLIDCHVHLGSTVEVDWAKEMMRSKDERFHYLALKHAQDHLKAGFTTLRDVGGGSWGAPLRRILEENVFPGPRLFVAQRTIGQFGNQEKMGPSEFIEAMTRYDVKPGPYGVIEAVRERKASGSDLIKTMTTGGVLHGMESQLDRSLWTEEELDAMVTEAHRLGMKVAVHAHGLHGIIKAAKAGVDTIEHCSFVNEEAAQIMIDNDVILVPTQTSAFMDKPDLMKSLPSEVQQKTIEVDTAMLVNHKMAFEMGVKIACGTDAGVPGNPHGTSARELTAYVKYLGMTPSQALQSATLVAAEALGRMESLGSIEPGKQADFVILDINPLDDIRNLEELDNIHAVFKSGMKMVEQGSKLTF
ncbi:MAG: amidohydrolase family protein [Candidatus Kariarchaeaceae archaeon]|jgi:imidazolonepropionase-like amidohydrolase